MPTFEVGGKAEEGCGPAAGEAMKRGGKGGGVFGYWVVSHGEDLWAERIRMVFRDGVGIFCIFSRRRRHVIHFHRRVLTW